MKGWIVAVLLVTFASGGTTGWVVGRATAPAPVVRTWVDNSVEQLRREGVTDPADLEAAREIYELYQERATSLQAQVKDLLAPNLDAYAADAKKSLNEIRAKYGLR